MNQQITTPEQLDALPVGSVILDLGKHLSEADAPVISCKAADGDWWVAGTPRIRRWRSFEIVRDSTGSVLVCVYRPDAAPVEPRTLPTAAEVANVMEAAFSDWVDRVTANEDVPETEYETMAAAVLALFAAQPTVAQVKAEAWDEGREALAAEFLQQLPASGMRTATRNPYRESEG